MFEILAEYKTVMKYKLETQYIKSNKYIPPYVVGGTHNNKLVLGGTHNNKLTKKYILKKY